MLWSSTATKETTVTTLTPTLQDALDDQVHHIRDLVLIRDLLARRGADADELADCDAVIEEQREALAALARASAEEYAAAA